MMVKKEFNLILDISIQTPILLGFCYKILYFCILSNVKALYFLNLSLKCWVLWLNVIKSSIFYGVQGILYEIVDGIERNLNKIFNLLYLGNDVKFVTFNNCLNLFQDGVLLNIESVFNLEKNIIKSEWNSINTFLNSILDNKYFIV